MQSSMCAMLRGCSDASRTNCLQQPHTVLLEGPAAACLEEFCHSGMESTDPLQAHFYNETLILPTSGAKSFGQ